MGIARSLKLGLEGEDVALLHKALAAIGIEIHETEIAACRFGDSTRDAVCRLQVLLGQEPSGDVTEHVLSALDAAYGRLREYVRDKDDKEETPPGDGECQITGTVTDTDGLPLANATVAASAQGLRQSREIGRARTNAAGRYAIAYPEPAEGTALDLQLRVLDDEGKVLYTSPIHFHVACRADIPLPLGGPERAAPAEFSLVERTLQPLLGELRPEELVENEQNQDLTFLTGETGLEEAWIALFAIAARLSQSTDLPPELFYGLFRQNLPADAAVTALASSAAGIDLAGNAQRLLKSALAASAEARGKAVDSAIAHNTIPAGYAGRAAQDLAQLAGLAATAALAENRGMGKTPIAAVLDAGGVAAATQQKFITLYAAATGPTRGFWRALATHPDFTQKEVADLRFSVNVGRFTKGHLPLVNLLVEMRRQGKLKGTRELARLSAAEWKDLLTRQGKGAPIGVPPNFTAKSQPDAVAAFADLLERNFARAHPTTAFSARLAADPQSPLPAKVAVAQFLDANVQVNLLRTNIDRYLKDNPQRRRASTLLPAAR